MPETTARPDIRQLCKDDGITQRELAKKLGVSPAMVSYIAQGKRPSYRLMLALREVFGADRCPLGGWE